MIKFVILRPNVMWMLVEHITDHVKPFLNDYFMKVNLRKDFIAKPN